MWTRAGKTEQRLAQRVNVILYSARSLTMREVSKKSGISAQNRGKWKRRFIEMGLEGPKDVQCPGRPKRISPHERRCVTELAALVSPNGRPSWTVGDLARESVLSATTAHRRLSERKLEPRKVEYWCGRSPDLAPHYGGLPKACFEMAIAMANLGHTKKALVIEIDSQPSGETKRTISRVPELDKAPLLVQIARTKLRRDFGTCNAPSSERMNSCTGMQP